MVERIFFDSRYRFTDPIRVFKPNDPYFYKVDNIPIQQLEENTKFLKDQIEGILGRDDGTVSIDRSGFTELKPYVDGTSRVVKVKPGKYSARINDAYSITPLQVIEKLSGFNVADDFNSWRAESLTSASVEAILRNLRDIVVPLNMNGLAERAFSFPIKNPDDTQSPLINITSPNPSYPGGALDLKPTFPNYSGKTWLSEGYKTLFLNDTANGSFGLYRSSIAESEFIKRWRGVTRTSIVNVENELSITIPEFDETEFYYFDRDGNRILLDATQRIDLVFIYSKPIDMSGVTISKYIAEQPIHITEPTLGIVRGAGIGISYANYADRNDNVFTVTNEGDAMILPSVGDENAENTGFGTIRGSFPSPDDLMNISPLLSETLEQNNYALIGQSILPVAYVVIRKDETGIQVQDIIDIRPFFRTTELSYNERAGIAAATPQLSIANPVATEGYVEVQVKGLYDDYTSKINALRAVQPEKPRLIGSGYVRGGYLYGVEGALASYISSQTGTTNHQRLRELVAARYMHQGGVVEDWPDWDIATWSQPLANGGEYPNDRINFHRFGSRSGSNPLPFGAFSNREWTSRLQRLGTDRADAIDWGEQTLYFVKKTIRLNRTYVPWVNDYHVDAQLWNCVPMTTRAGNHQAMAGSTGIWIDKRRDEFTIFASWVAYDHNNSNSVVSENRDVGSKFAGFTVMNNDIMSIQNNNFGVQGEAAAGVCIYPTISFQITGIPGTFNSNLTGTGGLLPSILLT